MIFKTNAKCEGCLAKIEEILQGKISREEWNLCIRKGFRENLMCQRKFYERHDVSTSRFINLGINTEQNILINCLTVVFVLLYKIKVYCYNYL